MQDLQTAGKTEVPRELRGGHETKGKVCSTILIRFRREWSIPSVARPGEGCNVVVVGKAANFRGFCTQGTEGRYRGYQAVPGKNTRL